MEKSFEKGIVLDLKSLIDYSEGGVISRQLIKSAAGNITLFSFDKGEGLSEHTAPFDALVQILEGTAEVTVNGTKFTVGKGESIVFPVNAPHAVFAVERFKMLLTMIKLRIKSEIWKSWAKILIGRRFRQYPQKV